MDAVVRTFLAVLMLALFIPGAYGANALEMMSVAFIGQPSVTEIDRRLSPAMRHYAVPLTEDGYQRIGSALVGVRKETGVPEMALITCVSAENYGLAQHVKITEAIALCAVMLEKKR